MTSDQDEPSANSPCTNTTLRAFGRLGVAAADCVNAVAVPATSAAENVLRSIIVNRLFREGITLIQPVCQADWRSMTDCQSRWRWGHIALVLSVRAFRPFTSPEPLAIRPANRAGQPSGVASPRCCSGTEKQASV